MICRRREWNIWLPISGLWLLDWWAEFDRWLQSTSQRLLGKRGKMPTRNRIWVIFGMRGLGQVLAVVVLFPNFGKVWGSHCRPWCWDAKSNLQDVMRHNSCGMWLQKPVLDKTNFIGNDQLCLWMCQVSGHGHFHSPITGVFHHSRWHSGSVDYYHLLHTALLHTVWHTGVYITVPW